MKIFTILFTLSVLTMGCTSRSQNTDEQAEQTEQTETAITVPQTENTQPGQAETADEQKKLAAKYAEAQFGSLVTNVANQRYGYFIYIDGQVVIEQKTIPAIPGTNGFVSKEEAQLVADLAIAKIRQGFMPPAITVEELKELGITGVN